MTDLSAPAGSIAPTSQPSVPVSELRRIERLRACGVELPDGQLADLTRRLIIAIHAGKGGVGKTTTARELAWIFDAVQLDFDWDEGGLSGLWGYRHETRVNAPLLDALETGKVPRPLKGDAFRADLVPGHPDLVENQPSADTTASLLEKWVQHWQRPVVVDNHPGGGSMAYGAMAAAQITVMPTPLEYLALKGLAGTLREMRGYNILIVPTIVPPVPPERMIAMLEDISQEYGVPVGPPISEVKAIKRRTRRQALTSIEPVPVTYANFVGDMKAVAKEVIDHAGRAA
ncbi:hypothetical protein GCM10009789_83340 [Kribbella sancticallisti]|uniref:CobQ/CobB/MinD/ParA nucleotide binding domain-containing protein n=1 Tax=Kribbella sancticallisti TaxID=460087 RepID=A0ABP4QQI2_9ACTN